MALKAPSLGASKNSLFSGKDTSAFLSSKNTDSTFKFAVTILSGEAGKGLIGFGNGLFTAQTVPNKAGDMVHRGMNTEYKIFDNIAGHQGNNTSIRGTVNILTEKAACASCLNVAEQLKAKYPNVEVNIF
nr:deaminase domain-containing protein [uncultured Achromobacter sp.]